MAARSRELAEPVSVLVVNRETHLAAEATTQLPDLISASVVTDRLGVSKQRAPDPATTGFPPSRSTTPGAIRCTCWPTTNATKTSTHVLQAALERRATPIPRADPFTWT